MRKIKIIALLLGFTSFCFFNVAKGMEDNLKEESALHSAPCPLYMVSIHKDAERLSNCDLRKKHPIYGVIHFGNLDEKLYKTKTNSKILEYNSSFKDVKEVLEKLKLLGHSNYGELKKIEIDARKHLFLATVSLIDGTNGMPKDRRYGLSLMRWYLSEENFSIKEDFYNKFFISQDFSVNDFVNDFHNREQDVLPESNIALFRLIVGC